MNYVVTQLGTDKKFSFIGDTPKDAISYMFYFLYKREPDDKEIYDTGTCYSFKHEEHTYSIVHAQLARLTVSKWGEITGTITEFFDEFVISPRSYLSTYVCYHSDGKLVIRYPGASRGCIEYDKDKIITSIRFYKEDGENDTVGYCTYRKEVQEAAQKYIGYKLVMH